MEAGEEPGGIKDEGEREEGDEAEVEEEGMRSRVKRCLSFSATICWSSGKVTWRDFSLGHASFAAC